MRQDPWPLIRAVQRVRKRSSNDSTQFAGRSVDQAAASNGYKLHKSLSLAPVLSLKREELQAAPTSKRTPSNNPAKHEISVRALVNSAVFGLKT